MFRVMAGFVARSLLLASPMIRRFLGHWKRSGSLPPPKSISPVADRRLTLVGVGLLFILVFRPAILPASRLMTWPPIRACRLPPVPAPHLDDAHVASISVAVWWKYKRRASWNRSKTVAVGPRLCERLRARVAGGSRRHDRHHWCSAHSWSNPAALLGFPYTHFSLWATIVATAVVVARDDRSPRAERSAGIPGSNCAVLRPRRGGERLRIELDHHPSRRLGSDARRSARLPAG